MDQRARFVDPCSGEKFIRLSQTHRTQSQDNDRILLHVGYCTWVGMTSLSVITNCSRQLLQSPRPSLSPRSTNPPLSNAKCLKPNYSPLSAFEHFATTRFWATTSWQGTNETEANRHKAAETRGHFAAHWHTLERAEGQNRTQWKKTRQLDNRRLHCSLAYYRLCNTVLKKP